MQTENRLLDDLAKLATSTLGSLRGARDEVEARLKDQLERIIRGMDLVRREEFEVVRAMAAKARAENEVLAKRIKALEPTAKAKTRRAAKPAARAKPAAARATKTTKAAKTAKGKTAKAATRRARKGGRARPARDS